jgi:hypothetical protein
LGNVGIGTNTPSKKLDVTGDINFTGNLYKNGSLFGSGSGKFVDGATPIDAVFTTGNVGIGTNSPSNKLEVNGIIKNHGAIKSKVIGGSHIISTKWFNCESSCSGDVKLHTPIYNRESNMFRIKISGYGYGSGGRNKEIICSGYAYRDGGLIKHACDTIVGSTSAYLTTVSRNGSNYIVVVLRNGAGYYNHYTYEYLG